MSNKESIEILATALSKKSGLTQEEAERFILKMFETLGRGLLADRQIKLRWLGAFKITPVKERESVDVNTGERILIEGRDKVTFTPDSILKEIINKPFAQFETVIVNDGVSFEEIDRKFESINDAEEEDNDVEEEVVSQTEMEQEEEATPIETPSPETPPTSLEQFEPAEPEPVEPEPTKLPDPTPDTVENEVIEIPKENEPVTEDHTESQDEPILSKRHIVLPKYMVLTTSVVGIILAIGIGWLAFNYREMVAQRDQLAVELNRYQSKKPIAIPQKPKPAPPVKSSEEQMKEKAHEDSVRLAQASEAVKAIEEEKKEKADQKEKKTEDSDKVKANQKEAVQKKEPVAEDYSSDARVRTGAYRIVGVDRVVTVKGGQSLIDISNKYLGPGMECYVEALNGITQVKDGQKIKIPKLELKKKKNITK